MTLRDEKHAAYEAAAKARDAARERFEQAQSTMWNAERLWRDAEMQVQHAFAALARANGERVDTK